ncbi:hypothetical protein KDA11_06765 [Candidatus Saccharibacteria bacterium]|nr:hypothetical protein [Candidatus Saccharibacteria bacterium]
MKKAQKELIAETLQSACMTNRCYVVELLYNGANYHIDVDYTGTCERLTISRKLHNELLVIFNKAFSHTAQQFATFTDNDVLFIAEIMKICIDCGCGSVFR